MREMTEQFLNLLYDPGESFCISPNKYGYHSVQKEDLDGEIKLLSPSEKMGDALITEDEILLAAINPIKGYRVDRNVTAHRSFLVEIDDGTLESQKEYIEKSGLPYSVCVYSGNKSLHYGIVLKYELPRSAWKHIAQWILNILTLADQQVKNPSRSIRFPGNKRKDGRQLVQSLVDIKERVDVEDLFDWLNKFPDKKPVQRIRKKVSGKFPSINNIPKKVIKTIEDGIEDNRNSTWFWVACYWASANFDLDVTINALERFYEEDSDFQRREWEGCIKSAFKHIQGI
jgi:hypothetical protein